VTCGLELPGAPVTFPRNMAAALASDTQVAPASTRAAPPPRPAVNPPRFDGTMAIETGAVLEQASTPFNPNAPVRPPPPAAPAVMAEGGPKKRTTVPLFESTVAYSADQLDRPAQSEAIPFQGLSASSVGRRPSEPPPASSTRDIPGAPWSAKAATNVAASPRMPEKFDGTAFIPSARDELAEAQRKIDEMEKAQAAKETAERARAEAEKKKLEAEQALVAAEERRKAEADRFVAEQAAARKEEERRVVEAALKKKQAAQDIKNQMYGGLKRKK
jgi:hypothetical protein